MHRFVRSRYRARFFLPLAVALACGGGHAPAPARPAPAPPAAPRIARVADANTAAILLTSLSADLAAARLATTRARHRDVKLLARSIVTDLTPSSTKLSRLLSSIKLNPREDDVSQMLRDQSYARRDTLRNLSGSRFDVVYIEGEVRFHEDLLVAIDSVFLPSARNASLKDYITAVRPTIASHLALAEQVRATITARR